MSKMLTLFGLVIWALGAHSSWAADRLLGVQSARVMSQSMPWIAEETGIFRKHNLEFPLVYIATSPLATAAMLGGEAQIMIDRRGTRSHCRGWQQRPRVHRGHQKPSDPEYSRQTRD